MNKFLILISITLCLVITTSHFSTVSAQSQRNTADFYLKKYDYGRSYKKDFYGKVIFIIITASWDLTFNNEYHKIKELQREFISKDVNFLYIIGDLPDRWKAFADDKGLKGNFYYLPSMSKDCNSCFLSSHFDENQITSYYIISKDGSLLGNKLPSLTKSDAIRKLLLGASSLEIN